MVEKCLQQLPSADPGVLFNQLLHTGDVFWCPRFQGLTGADSILQGESATLDLTTPTLDGSKGRAGLREGYGEVLMDLGDGFPKFVATQSVGAKVWIFRMQRQPDKVIKIWLASFFMGCLGKMQDGFNPKLPKKHDTVNHYGPFQMVLELISVRQSFPNNLIFQSRQ